MIGCHLYDCGGPGPSSLADYIELVLLGGIHFAIGSQSAIDALFHGAYIAFLCCVLLTEYISVIDRFVRT